MIEGGGPDRGIGAIHAPVVVLSGPSAVGKSSVVRCLRERVADLYFSVSVTTRAPRPGEVDGVDYTFVTPERFQQLIDDGALLEWAEIHGGLHRSGTPAEPVRSAAAAGRRWARGASRGVASPVPKYEVRVWSAAASFGAGAA